MLELSAIWALDFSWRFAALPSQ